VSALNQLVELSGDVEAGRFGASFAVVFVFVRESSGDGALLGRSEGGMRDVHDRFGFAFRR